MPALLNRHGDDDNGPGGPLFSNHMDASLFLALAPRVDVCCPPPRKRSRVSAPFIFREGDEEGADLQKKQICSIDALPDECLFEILRRLQGKQERSVAACISRRWLALLSSLRSSEISAASHGKPLPDLNGKSGDVDGELDKEGGGYLTRCLEGKEATDTRLSALAIGTSGRGGLGKLLIRGSNNMRGVTDVGLAAVARGCPSLRVLSIWDAPLIGDEGLSEIAEGCPMLEKLDLCRCPLVSDKGLSAIAARCPNLSSLKIESCSNIGNEGLKAVGRCCLNLGSVSITGCLHVGDQGVASLVSSASSSLRKIKLQSLNNITDASLGVVGLYGRMVTNLVFSRLQNVGERGFWVMGAARGLQQLKSLTVVSCGGATDLGLEAVAKGCPQLKQLSLGKCCHWSDAGLRAFAGAAGSLEILEMEECNRVTLVGVLAALLNCSARLKTLALVKCMGIKDIISCPTPLPSCVSLRSLSIRHCPGFGWSSMSMIGELCPQLQHIDLSGLLGVTDAGLLPLIESCESSSGGLVKVNLSGCVNVTDTVVSALARVHGGTLQMLNLEGCRKVTDESMLAIADKCCGLVDLDVSRCGITDYGIAALASARQLNLQVLSLSGCSSVSGRSLPFLGNLGQSLIGLNLQQCNMIGARVIGSLEEKMWWCDILS